MFTTLFLLLVAVVAFPVLSILGVLPTPFLSLFALANHALRKKAKFAPKKKRTFNFNEIVKGLFVGTQPRGEADLSTLRKKAGVTAVVSLNEEYELYVPSDHHAFTTVTAAEFSKNPEAFVGSASDWKFPRLHIPVPDYQGPSTEMLKTAVKFINMQLQKGQKVFVHCNGGKGRSVAVAVAYLLAKNAADQEKGGKLKYEDVVAQVKERREQTSNSLLRYPYNSQSRNLRAFEEYTRETPILENVIKVAPVALQVAPSNSPEVLAAPPPKAVPVSEIRQRGVTSAI